MGLTVIVLDTPHAYDPGHSKPAEVHNHVFLREFESDSTGRRMTLMFQYGNVVNGNWVAGNAPDDRVVIENLPAQIDPSDPGQGVPEDPAFNVLVGTTLVDQAHVGLPLYGVVANSLYLHILSRGHYQGTPQYVE